MTLSPAAAARLTGAKPSEISDVLDSPAGDVIQMTDGTSLINVPAGAPDADGKTGLMFLVAPLNEDGKYLGTFPVYAQPTDDEPADDDDGRPEWAKAKVEDILAYATLHLDEVDVLLGIEKAHKNRKTAIDGLEALRSGGSQ